MTLNCVSFNQDFTHLAVGTSNGFRIYYTDPFASCHQTRQGNVTLVEMLFSTSLVALVNSPRRLEIRNTKRGSTICELTFPTAILSVKLNRKRLVVILEDQIFLYDISNMKLVHTINTSPNPHGIGALSPSSERCYLAYPLPLQTQTPTFTPPAHVPPTPPHLNVTSGHVLLYDAIAMQAVNVIEAHRAPLSIIAMNSDGTRVATASEKGTIIRVFSVPEAEKIFQFRRGSMPARILSMSFNVTSTLLCVSSATDTVHIFRLSKTNEAITMPERSLSPSSDDNGRVSSGLDESLDRIANRKHNGTLAGMIRRTSQSVTSSFAASIGSYLPTAVSEMLEPARDFAWIKLPKPNATGPGALNSVVAMSSNSPRIMVAVSDGNLLAYDIDLEVGGECTLIREFSLSEPPERPPRSPLEE